MKKITLKRILIAFFALVLLVLAGGVLFYYLVKTGVFGPLPGEEDLTDISNATATVVYSSDGEQIGRIFAENRTNEDFKDLPNHLVNALVATEDARFFEHEGVDKRSLLRVLVKSILMGDESAGGGSTITQQLAKNLYGRKRFGFLSLPVNKTKEIILAQRLESLYSKEDIIELYLNTVPFSENMYGIETASQRFFSKQPAALQAHESAVLVGMLKANTYYNPRLHPDNARQRRQVVLHQMYRYGYLSEREKDSLQAMPLEVDYRNPLQDAPAPYFMAHVRQQALDILNQKSEKDQKSVLEQDGLRIYTTLNAKMQGYAQAAVRKHMAGLQKIFDRHWQGRSAWKEHPEVFENELKRSSSYKNLESRRLSVDSINYYLNKPHPVSVYHGGADSVMEMSIRDSVAHYLQMLKAAFMAMDPQSGAVLAWVGGLDHQLMPYDHVLAERQAASTFKPIVYATALRQGANPCDYIANEQRRYKAYDDWTPANYDHKYGGYYSMAGALKKSINVAAVQTLFEAGIGNVVATAHQMGIESSIPKDPSIALGTASMSLYEMLQAYAVFANTGQRKPPYLIDRIEDAEGNLLYQADQDPPQEVLSERVASLMNEMLQGVINEGTGKRLRTTYGIRAELAGKTGTAQNYADGWFIGYNPKIVAGAWVGASSPVVHFRSGTYGSGSAMALPIFARFYQGITSESDLRYTTTASFDSLPSEWRRELDCADFREENIFDSFQGIFNKKAGEKVKHTKDEEDEKPGFFKRLFGGGKKK